MLDFYRNNYVLQVEDLRDGKSYKVISTLEHYQTLIREIRQALEKPEASLRSGYLKPHHPTPLWDAWATISSKKTDRVKLQFEIADSLASYHRFSGIYYNYYNSIGTSLVSAQAESEIAPAESREYVLLIEYVKNWQFHHIVSTREHMKRLIDDLTEALKRVTTNESEGTERSEPRPFWQADAWALTWRNRGRRMNCIFELATDLERYHDYRKFQRDTRISNLELAGVLVVVVAGAGYVLYRFGTLGLLSLIIGLVAIVALARKLFTVWPRIRSRHE